MVLTGRRATAAASEEDKASAVAAVATTATLVDEVCDLVVGDATTTSITGNSKQATGEQPFSAPSSDAMRRTKGGGVEKVWPVVQRFLIGE